MLKWKKIGAQSLVNQREQNILKKDEYGNRVSAEANNNLKNKTKDLWEINNHRNVEDSQFISFDVNAEYLEKSEHQHANANIIEIHYLRAPKGQSEIDTIMGKNTISEELQSDTTPFSNSKKAINHRMEVASPDEAKEEVEEEHSEATVESLEEAIFLAVSKGEMRMPERGCEELAKMLKKEVQDTFEKMKKDSEVQQEIYDAITSKATEIVNYWKIADEIDRSGECYPFGTKSIFEEIIKDRVNNSNEPVDKDSLKNRIVNVLNKQKVMEGGIPDPRYVA